MAALSALATIAQVAATAVSAAGTIAAGNAANAGAKYQAKQLEAAGTQELAGSQREADQLRRRKELALSSLTARSAGSGFSATDPTTLGLGEDIESYGTLQELSALYGGKASRAGRQAQADAARWEGKVAAQQSRVKAAATILGGASSIMQRYMPAKSAVETSPYYFGNSAAPAGWHPPMAPPTGYR